MDSEEPPRGVPPLSSGERLELLHLARASIRSALHHLPLPHPQHLTPRLEAPGAAFVSLHIGTTLRGCVGTLYAEHPLHITVVDRARAAAFEDPRFPPLTEPELAVVSIEISRLGPLVTVRPDAVHPAIHGVCVSARECRGVFLPHVATHYGWDRETLLREVCLKALLPPDAWQWPETQVEVFEVEVFGE